MHQSSGRWKMGLMLTLVTCFLWGTLPIALKGLLQNMDAITVSWYRFLAAAILTWLLLAKKKSLPNIKWLKQKKGLFLYVMAILGLSSNYLFYLMGLDRVTPSAAQVIIQLAPLFLLIGGLVFFNEKFNWLQWAGMCLFLAGLFLFFNHRIESVLSTDKTYLWGMAFIIIAAITWAAYALAQKQLLMAYSSQQVMLIIYLISSLLFLPGVDFSAITQLSNLQWWLLIYCCLNTLIAYGCFAEALEHWEASRVSAMLSLTPLLTIVFAFLTNYFYPDYIQIEKLNWLSLLGGLILVVGASLTALSGRKKA